MTHSRDSQNIKESLETWMQHRLSPRKSSESYDEYLVAMKRAHHAMSEKDLSSPRARYRHKTAAENNKKNNRRYSRDLEDLMHISTIASMVPDEIISNYADYSLRSYETALMFIDVSGFTELCESYTKSGRGGPSKITQVLNSYIGAMVQEILTHNGDVLKFSGDAFLSMWKKTAKMTMQDVVHTAIDCGLAIQKNYATHVTDLGVTLKVKVAISAGVSHFAIIGGDPLSTYIIVGQPVWDVKAAEYMSHAGDVLTTASTWTYVNEAEYCTQPCGDGRHTKVLGVGVTWKRVEKIDFASTLHYSRGAFISTDLSASMANPSTTGIAKAVDTVEDALDTEEAAYKEYSLRPAVISALRSSWWPSLRRFMVTPVLRAVDNDEHMDFLTEVRHVVVVFLNIVTKTVTEDVLVDTVDIAYKQVCSVTLESGGLVNKVSMFDKDMMFLVVFGLRGLKHEDEAQKALLCAFQLKETLQDPNILHVSIGVTSGRTYCGVVGHVLRREYTVIGSSVNKAARLMMCYPDKVTCDKETFVRSKLDLDMFRLMEPKQLKGIAKPGPIYQFSKSGWPERRKLIRHPTLGRNEELRTYRSALENAEMRQRERFTRYRDLRFGIIVLGPRLVGKTRLVDEFINMTPSQHKVLRISLTATDKTSYAFTRLLLQKLYAGSNTNLKNVRDIFSSRIRHSIGMMEVTPLQIHALNIIFNLRFPLPETFDYTGDDMLSEPTVRELVKELFNVSNEYLMVVAVSEGQFIDDESWRVLLLVLDTKSIFIIIVINDHDQLSDMAKTSVANNIFVKMHLRGIDRWYHAALACQLLDVQAIPADLEKVLESASGGLPGWIQNFVISLVQRGELSVVTVPRSEAVDAGAVMPLAAMLQRAADEASRDVDIVSTTTSAQSNKMSKTGEVIAENETIQMAVLAENYNFDNMKVDMTMDVIILKTYDSLTPFEKMLLKCGSVLGEIFSRRMLLHLLQSDSQRKVAMAVAKLFEIRVLECEGGDFSRNTSMVLIHSAPVPTDAVKPPNCACLGTRAPPDCRDLPMYSFCGYMKFRHSLFRTTTYELLTENQKQEMHSRSLMYLERYTRRCTSCGSGCFISLFGVRSDDGLVIESRELRRVRQQIAALSEETRIVSETLSDAGITSIDNAKTSDTDIIGKEDKRTVGKEEKSSKKPKPVRSFSSLDVENCECLPILLSVYNQVIDHCKVVGDCNKLFETYMEYVDLSLLTMNIPQAIRLLMDAEKDIEVEKACKSEICMIPWIKDYKYGRILTWRGCCMLESGDISEARKHLLRAMELFGCKFPTNKAGVKISDMQASLQQFWSLYIIPKKNKPIGWVGKFYDHISRTLSQLFRLFMECKELEKATLAAKWSLKFARKSNSTFRILCLSYGNMISIYRQSHNFSKCLKLEKLAMDICHRKRGNLDITEVFSVCVLYTNIFFFYVEQGRKSESLDFGLSIIPMMSSQPDVTIGQMLVQWMLKLLLCDLRIHEMVMIMREFYYMTDFYDLSSETWYYYHAMIILLDTGYCVESYGTCEKFYIKQGDAILRSKTPEAAWNFFAVMWLVTLRIGAWERSILWEDKLKKILPQVYQCTEFNIMLLNRLVECFMIGLVNEIDNRNLKKIIILEKQVQNIIKNIKKMIKVMPLYKPRSLLLHAYYYQVKNNKSIAHRYINKAGELAKQFGNNVLNIWIEHTKEHWKGTLNPKLKDYWTEHIEVHSMLDYKTFDPENSKIVPYTLPLPRDFE